MPVADDGLLLGINSSIICSYTIVINANFSTLSLFFIKYLQEFRPYKSLSYIPIIKQAVISQPKVSYQIHQEGHPDSLYDYLPIYNVLPNQNLFSPINDIYTNDLTPDWQIKF